MGSVPLVERDFARPAFAQWSNFSLTIQRICTYDCGDPEKSSFRTLPPAGGPRQLALQWGALRHSRTFDCEPQNEAFSGYVARGLRKLVECNAAGAADAPLLGASRTRRDPARCTPLEPLGQKLCMRHRYALPSCERFVNASEPASRTQGGG